MRKLLPLVFACFVGIGMSNAAVRDATTVSRQSSQNTPTARTTNQTRVISRTTATQSVKSRPAQPTVVVSRGTTSRGAVTGTRRASTRSTTSQPTGRARAGTVSNASRAATNSARARATVVNTANSKTFGTGYNTCRDAYFTCMDQFCATSDDTYRRCICSSRLNEIKSKQRALGQSAEQLQDFKDLNIEAIPKTPAEVKAMLTASEGEMVSSVIRDKSASIAQLNGISAVLSKAKSKSLSTAGQLDIAGDINAIWATTDLTSGLNISNLTGETLYSAVHSQCVNLVGERCSSKSLLNMVVSAYSMYIENDCSLLANALDKQKTTANAAIRETERDMNVARLENYDAHNSSSINDCLAMVRNDITSDTACGTDYIHCLDVSGLYLNKTTGEPIYTSNFYQLGSTLSLSGNILTNQANRTLVMELNRKRIFAEKSLDTCRDLADEVWDEFMRQAIAEIYQGQQTRIRNVRNECLDVVNKCYDSQSNSLRDFSNVKEQLLLGARLELSEELCREKLSTCSNLYGGGQNGLSELLTAMADITTQKIAQNCFATLQDYAQQLCAVPSNDSLHSYPYACRAYAPGEQRYAMDWNCNKAEKQIVTNAFPVTITSDTDDTENPQDIPSNNSTIGGYSCDRMYTSCARGYFMANSSGKPIFTPESGNRCLVCPGGICPTQNPGNEEEEGEDPGYTFNDYPCGTDYAGSLYQKLVRYAVQACLRPSVIEELNAGTQTDLPDSLLQDVNATMDLIRVSMASSLKSECERLGGHWVASQWDESVANNTGIKLFLQFYNETGANTKWGYCANKNSVAKYYTGEEIQDESDSATGSNGENNNAGSGNGNNGGNSGGNSGDGLSDDDYYAKATSEPYEYENCSAADDNDTLAGCVSAGYKCPTDYRVYNGQCVGDCFAPAYSDPTCNRISTNGTSGGCATFYCRCPTGKYSLYLDHNGGGTCN